MKKITLLLLFVSIALGASAQTADDAVRYNQYGVAVKRTPLSVEMRDGNLVFESANQRYKFWFDARVQMDGAVFFGEKDFMNPIGNGVTNRRTRFAVKAQITKNWYGEIETDFANGDFELKNALVRFNTCGWQLSLGNFKEDFSMEQTTSSRHLMFMERPMAVQAFSPSRHLGLDVSFVRNWFYWSAGVFFQSVDNMETSAFVQDNNRDYGRNQGVSYTAKLRFMPFYNKEHYGLHIGIGESYRTPKTDVAELDGIRYSLRNSTPINNKKYLDTDVIPGMDHQHLYNVELAGHYNGLRLQGEYIATNIYINKDAPANVDKQMKRFCGWYAQAGVMLFGGQQRYNPNEGAFTQPSRGRVWGDIELTARYDYIDLNNKVLGGAGENYTVGLTYYINNSLKFMINYQYSNNDRYANGNGGLFVGRDAAGVATSNYRDVVDAKGKAGVRYSMLGCRFEIDF